MSCKYYNTYSVGEKFLSSIEFEAKKRKLNNLNMLLCWKDIVGEDFARKITPNKVLFSNYINSNNESVNKQSKNDKANNIIGKILCCTTSNISFLNEFIFYKKDLLNRINLYFGEEKSKFIDIKLSLL